MVSTPIIHIITTHLLTPEGWEAEFTEWLTHSGQLTHKVVTRQPQVRESPPA